MKQNTTQLNIGNVVNDHNQKEQYLNGLRQKIATHMLQNKPYDHMIDQYVAEATTPYTHTGEYR